MNSRDETRTLRGRDTDRLADLDRTANEEPAPAAAILARTVTVTTYPTTAGKVIACQALTISVTEVEGAAPTLTLVPGVFYSVHIGTNLPPVGSDVLLEMVDGLWVLRS